jgi:hypothetical protein
MDHCSAVTTREMLVLSQHLSENDAVKRFEHLALDLDTRFEDDGYIERLSGAFIDGYLKFDDGRLPTIRKTLKKLLHKAIVKKQRVYMLPKHQPTIVAKVNDVVDERDDSIRESAIGFALNKIRAKLPAPNFVYTIGAFEAPIITPEGESEPPKGFRFDKNYKYVVTQYVKGDHFGRFKEGKSLTELMPIYLQFFFATHMAYLECGFTHYDAHSGNTIVQKVPSGRRPIVYPWGTVTTNYYATIIDTGRSHAIVDGRSIGRTIQRHSVDICPQEWYDIYFILARTLPSSAKESPDGKALLRFFWPDVATPRFANDEYNDMPLIVRRRYNWDEFIEVLFKLTSTKHCLSRNQISIPRAPAPLARAPVPVVPTTLMVAPPINPTFEELVTWVKTSRKSQMMRQELMNLIERDQGRYQRAKRILSLLTERTPVPFGELYLPGVRETEHTVLLNGIEELATTRKSLSLKPTIQTIIHYYKSRVERWEKFLEHQFGG